MRDKLSEDFQADEKWLTEIKAGELIITRARSHSKCNEGPSLSASLCVALALNEACCEQGWGKVRHCGGVQGGTNRPQIYTVLPDPVTSELPNFAPDDASFVHSPTPILQRLPELFYIPERWSATSVEEWKANDPV
jgi:hypothetical protein